MRAEAVRWAKRLPMIGETVNGGRQYFFLGVFGLLGLITAFLVTPAVSASDRVDPHDALHEEGIDHSHDYSDGLGDYGTHGVIERAMLPENLRHYVSDESLQLAASAELAEARRKWTGPEDFVAQVDYHLSFRAERDYMTTDPAHLNRLMVDRAKNFGTDYLALELSDEEIAELQRRLDLGDRSAEIMRALPGYEPPPLEGEEERLPDYFGGLWQDQGNGGVLVLAVTDRARLDIEALREFTSSGALKIIEQPYSKAELREFRSQARQALGDIDIETDIAMPLTESGRFLEIRVNESDLRAANSAMSKLLPDDLYEVVVGPAGETSTTRPRWIHTFTNMMAGLAIHVDYDWPSNDHYSVCSWGLSGHTSNRSYLISAGHCFDDSLGNTPYYYSDWVHNSVMSISQSYHATHPRELGLLGNEYLKYRFDGSVSGGFDVGRWSTNYADNNCYHYDYKASFSHCARKFQSRAFYNSWTEGSDITCASLAGTTNLWRCGTILEEDTSPTDNKFRAAIDVQLGDSGAGAIFTTIIDGLQVSEPTGSTTESFFHTAYHVKSQLGGNSFDFNCAIGQTHGPPSTWSTCPVVPR